MACSLLFLLLLSSAPLAFGNKTAVWLNARANLIDKVYGKGPGALPTRAVPDQILTWPEDKDPRSKGLQGLVWNMTTLFEITSTVFYSPASGDSKVRSKTAFLFHHGHSNCDCEGKTALEKAKCRPGCKSSMPSVAQNPDEYTWWDLYNVSSYYHSLGHDVFILSMPLKGINLGPGMKANDARVNDNHWWFLQWEQRGDSALRYFLEPAYLTVNYAKAQGYETIYMAGLSGGGWSTTFASAIDKRITASFPIAGSTPCAMRNPTGIFPGQNWTGDDDEDFEQSCRPPTSVAHPSGDLQPGRAAFQACNYTCQYLLAGLEPGRFQVQILHEYDTCCFSPHNRHSGMLRYERNIRNELMADDRAGSTGLHGWFTTVATNHSKHEVAAQDKTVMANALRMHAKPNSAEWATIPCDVMHQPLPAHCAPDVEPGLVRPGDAPYVPMCPKGNSREKIPCSCTRPPQFPCLSGLGLHEGGISSAGFTSVHTYFASV